jgi:DNA-binding response OmpR family regulator
MSKKILLIEDDRFLRELMSRKLSEGGFDVTQAVDGESGVEKSKDGGFDMILLDLILPGIDGFEVLRKIKENEASSSIPVIILSNLGQREEVDKGLELGAVDFLIKAHFTPGEIIKKISKIL